MALTLYILRHAHATHDHAYADFDRPLTEAGKREASAIGKLMATREQKPARILCSSAQRTRETLTGVLNALNHECEVGLTRKLYDVSADRLLGIVREQGDISSLMLVGHNPGLAELAVSMSGTGDGVALGHLHEAFKPASLAVIDFDAENWNDVHADIGRLVAFEQP